MSEARTIVQESAFDQFARLKVGALFLEQGSGKTRVALDLLTHNRDRIDRAIWLTPFSVKATIRTELDRWGCPVPVEVVGYETLSGSDREYLRLLDLARAGRVAVIADESIFIKNMDAIRSQRARELRRGASFALILNGTPVTRDLWDLKRQVDFLDPRIIGMGDSEFRARYFTTIRYRKSTGEAGEFDKVYQPNVAHLMSLVEPYMLLARLDLPVGESIRVVTHEPSDETAEAYNTVKRVVLDEYRREGGAGMLRGLSQLSSLAACDPARAPLVAKHVAGRCVVFTTYLAETRALAAALPAVTVITGATPVDERRDRIAAWSSGDHPLILTIGTGAFGLNLQATSTVHFASLGFDFARVEQARKRTRRLGQAHDLLTVEHDSTLGVSRLIRDNLRTKDFLARLVRREINLEAVL